MPGPLLTLEHRIKQVRQDPCLHGSSIFGAGSRKGVGAQTDNKHVNK